MSLIQFPVASPTPFIVHERGTLPKLIAVSMVKSGAMYQMKTSPVIVLRHKMSAIPSPSKSPTACGCQPDPPPTLAGKNPAENAPLPVIFQIATCPLDG